MNADDKRPALERRGTNSPARDTSRPAEAPPPPWRLLSICSLLALVTFVVYFPVRHHEFLNWDDLTYVEGNDHVKGGLTWEGTVWAFTRSYSANWHPLTWISHMLDCQLFGLNAGVHHLVNVAFHVANTLLL